MDPKYIDFSFDFECEKCKTKTLINTKFPNFIIESPITIKDQYCPVCNNQVTTPEGKYRIRNHRLVSIYDS